MSNSAPPVFRINRRTFLKAGIAGGAALLFARWLYTSTSASPQPPHSALDAAARTIMAAIIPVLLDGALPTGADPATARAETLIAVEQAIAGLPPAVREELAELFSLLAFAPTRCLLAGVWSPWSEVSTDAIAGFLARWRDSRFTLLRSAYGALHQLVLGAWYAQERAWPAIGYAGPPNLSVG